MGLLGLVKLGVAMARSLRAGSRKEEALRALPLAQFVPAVAAILGTAPPAGGCAAAEREHWRHRHGLLLPPELQAFYTLANGLPAGPAGWPGVAPLGELAIAGSAQPPFGAQLLADWEAWGRDHGEPFGLKVMAPSLADLVADDFERVLPFTDTDRMLVLCAPGPGRATLMVAAPHPDLPVGTVLDVENLLATRFDGLQAWLAHAAGLFGGQGTMPATLAAARG